MSDLRECHYKRIKPEYCDGYTKSQCSKCVTYCLGPAVDRLLREREEHPAGKISGKEQANMREVFKRLYNAPISLKLEEIAGNDLSVRAVKTAIKHLSLVPVVSEQIIPHLDGTYVAGRGVPTDSADKIMFIYHDLLKYMRLYIKARGEIRKMKKQII